MLNIGGDIGRCAVTGVDGDKRSLLREIAAVK